MFVNRKKIRLGSIVGDNINFNITIPTNANPLDNEDVVKNKFIDKEVEKAINGVVDYKKVRFKPAIIDNGNWKIVPEIKINLFFRYEGDYINTYDILGFNSENLFCRVNGLIKSYLTLDYYDSNNSVENKFLTSANIYTQMGSDQLNSVGIPKKSNECPISYRLGSPTMRPDMVHEGFHIYWYASDVLNTPNSEYTIYLSPTYQNAGNGKVSIMVPTKGGVTGINSEELQYTKVKLKYWRGNFVYGIEANDVRQLKENGGGIDWNTNSEGIPTITFYEALNNNNSKSTDMVSGVSSDEKSFAAQQREEERKKTEEEIEEMKDLPKNVNVGLTEAQESATGEVGDGVGATGTGIG